MRIAIASSGLGHVTRGVEAWAEDLAHALHVRGEHVVLYRGAGEAARPYERVVRCWTREGRSARRLVKLLPRVVGWRLGLESPYGVEQATFAFGLIRRLRKERIDVLHVQDPMVALLMQHARAIGLVRTKTILAHGTEEPEMFLQRIEHLQHLAPWHLENVRTKGAWRPTWTAIPNFIDVEKFHPGRDEDLRRELDLPAEGVVVLTAAAIKRHHKRIDYLIAEFARLRAARPDLPVWLVVAGGWERGTDELVEEGRRTLGERVRFLVRFPREKMARLYRAADVFALCSLFEMMPIALIEAAASGLPCVVHQHPILKWMTGAGGVARDMSEPGSLSAALEPLAGAATERAALGAAARRHCVSHFSCDAVVDLIRGYYASVLTAAGIDRRPQCASA